MVSWVWEGSSSEASPGLAEVLQRSLERPIVVEFWAEGSPASQTLDLVLRELASEAEGRWALVRLDVDRDRDVVEDAGIVQIPALLAYAEGRRVAQFSGPLLKSRLRAWLVSLSTPRGAEAAAEQGAAAEGRGDLEEAAEAYRLCLVQDPTYPEARAGLARVGLALRVRGLDETSLRQRHERDPSGAEAALSLADLDFARGEADAAFVRIIDVVRTHGGEERERARRRMVGLMEILPLGDPRVASAGRDLANALY